MDSWESAYNEVLEERARSGRRKPPGESWGKTGSRMAGIGYAEPPARVSGTGEGGPEYEEAEYFKSAPIQKPPPLKEGSMGATMAPTPTITPEMGEEIYTKGILTALAAPDQDERTPLEPRQEAQFNKWFNTEAHELPSGPIWPDPDDQRHHYDWRGAWYAGAKPDAQGNWPKEFRMEGHSKLYETTPKGYIQNTRTGELLPPQFIESVINRWRMGNAMIENGLVGTDAMLERIAPEKRDKLWAEIDAVVAEAESRVRPFSWNPYDFATAAAGWSVELVPYIGRSFKEGLKYSVIGAGGGAAVGTGVGAFTGPGIIPSAVAGLKIGGKVGFKFGVVKSAMEVEGGNIYKQLVQEDVSHENARLVALPAGLAIGLIEVTQIGILARRLPGGDKLFKKKVIEEITKNQGMRQILWTGVRKLTGDVLKETRQEEYQELISIGAEAMAHFIQSVQDDTDYRGPGPQEALQRLWETGYGSLRAFPGIAAPGVIYETAAPRVGPKIKSGIQDYREKRRAKRQAGDQAGKTRPLDEAEEKLAHEERRQAHQERLKKFRGVPFEDIVNKSKYLKWSVQHLNEQGVTEEMEVKRLAAEYVLDHFDNLQEAKDFITAGKPLSPQRTHGPVESPLRPEDVDWALMMSPDYLEEAIKSPPTAEPKEGEIKLTAIQADTGEWIIQEDTYDKKKGRWTTTYNTDIPFDSEQEAQDFIDHGAEGVTEAEKKTEIPEEKDYLEKAAQDQLGKPWAKAKLTERRKALTGYQEKADKPVPVRSLQEKEVSDLARPANVTADWKSGRRGLSVPDKDGLYTTDGKILIIDKDIAKQTRDDFWAKQEAALAKEMQKQGKSFEEAQAEAKEATKLEREANDKDFTAPNFSQVIPEDAGRPAKYLGMIWSPERKQPTMYYSDGKTLVALDGGYIRLLHKSFPDLTVHIHDGNVVSIFEGNKRKAVLMSMRDTEETGFTAEEATKGYKPPEKKEKKKEKKEPKPKPPVSEVVYPKAGEKWKIKETLEDARGASKTFKDTAEITKVDTKWIHYKTDKGSTGTISRDAWATLYARGDVGKVEATPKETTREGKDVTQEIINQQKYAKRNNEYRVKFTTKKEGAPLTKTEKAALEKIPPEGIDLGNVSNAGLYAPWIKRLTKPQRSALFSLLSSGKLKVIEVPDPEGKLGKEPIGGTGARRFIIKALPESKEGLTAEQKVALIDDQDLVKKLRKEGLSNKVIWVVYDSREDILAGKIAHDGKGLGMKIPKKVQDIVREHYGAEKPKTQKGKWKKSKDHGFDVWELADTEWKIVQEDEKFDIYKGLNLIHTELDLDRAKALVEEEAGPKTEGEDRTVEKKKRRLKHWTTEESAGALAGGAEFDITRDPVHAIMAGKGEGKTLSRFAGNRLYLSLDDKRWSKATSSDKTVEAVPVGDLGALKKIDSAKDAVFYDYDKQEWMVRKGALRTTPLSPVEYDVDPDAKILVIDSQEALKKAQLAAEVDWMSKDVGMNEAFWKNLKERLRIDIVEIRNVKENEGHPFFDSAGGDTAIVLNMDKVSVVEKEAGAKGDKKAEAEEAEEKEKKPRKRIKSFYLSRRAYGEGTQKAPMRTVYWAGSKYGWVGSESDHIKTYSTEKRAAAAGRKLVGKGWPGVEVGEYEITETGETVYKKDLKAEAEERKEYIREQKKLGRKWIRKHPNEPFTAKTRTGDRVQAAPDPDEYGKWRLTYFDRDHPNNETSTLYDSFNAIFWDQDNDIDYETLELGGAEAEAKTQKEKVEEAVSKKPKHIKQVAKETEILEPNVRRILGVGAKDGTFERVDKGVYILRREGQAVAYIQVGDAKRVLKKLADSGQVIDMAFLDIPYETAGVKGGNRGIDYKTIGPAELRDKVLAPVRKMLKTSRSPVVFMYSNAKSGWFQMKKYVDVMMDSGMALVAQGTYSKTYKSGKPMKFGKYTMPPEGILVFNESGDNADIGFPALPEIFDIKAVAPLYKGHYQTEKAKALLEKLILETTAEGEVVLDPFAGSGVTLEQAIKAGRKAIGVEISEEAVEKHIKPRVEKAEGQRRAKAGGEFGANGEWYEGGKFIATTDHPKSQRRWTKPTGKQEVGPGKWVRPPETADNVIAVGLYKAIAGVETRLTTGDYTLNQNLKGRFATEEAINERRAYIDAWNKGALWRLMAVDDEGKRTPIGYADEGGRAIVEPEKAGKKAKKKPAPAGKPIALITKERIEGAWKGMDQKTRPGGYQKPLSYLKAVARKLGKDFLDNPVFTLEKYKDRIYLTYKKNGLELRLVPELFGFPPWNINDKAVGKTIGIDPGLLKGVHPESLTAKTPGLRPLPKGIPPLVAQHENTLFDMAEKGGYEYQALGTIGDDTVGLKVEGANIDYADYTTYNLRTGKWAGKPEIKTLPKNLVKAIEQLGEIYREKKGKGAAGIAEGPPQPGYGVAPWTVKTTGAGDLYVTRTGQNAGQVSRERKSKNDFAITTDSNVLIPDFLYYVLKYLEPQLRNRQRGAAIPHLIKKDVDDVLREHFQKGTAGVAEGPPQPGYDKGVMPKNGVVHRTKTNQDIINNDPDWLAGKERGDVEAAERFVESHWDKKKTAAVAARLKDPTNTVFLSVPSSSGGNVHPIALGRKLALDLGGFFLNGDKQFNALHRTQSKDLKIGERQSEPRIYKAVDPDELRRILAGKEVVVVDDIFTTGGSSASLIHALRKLGIPVNTVAGYYGESRLNIDSVQYSKLSKALGRAGLIGLAKKIKNYLTRQEAGDMIRRVNRARTDNARQKIAKEIQGILDVRAAEDLPADQGRGRDTGRRAGGADRGNEGPSPGVRARPGSPGIDVTYPEGVSEGPGQLNWDELDNGDYYFCADCVNSTAEKIDALMDSAEEITYDKLLSVVGEESVREVFGENAGYAWGNEEGLKLKDDFAISYYRGIYDGAPAYVIQHSAIEYIFTSGIAEGPRGVSERKGPYIGRRRSESAKAEKARKKKKAAAWKRYSENKPDEWGVWRGMKWRCQYPGHKWYEYYGGRGIEVCKRWREHRTGFKNFMMDMGPPPTENHELHRKDPDGNYTPENCEWKDRSDHRGDHNRGRAVNEDERPYSADLDLDGPHDNLSSDPLLIEDDLLSRAEERAELAFFPKSESPLEAETKKTTNIRDIAQFMRTYFKVPILGKGTHRFRASAIYKIVPEVIRSRQFENIFAIAHEVGHHLEKKVWGNKKGRPHFRKWRTELANLDYDQKKRRSNEGFAEFLRFWLTGGKEAMEYLKGIAPEFLRYWENEFLPSEKYWSKGLYKTKDMFRVFREQGAFNRVLGQIDFKGKQPKIAKMKAFRLALMKLRTRLFDDITPMEWILKEFDVKLPPSQNPVEIARMLKGKAGAQARNWVMNEQTDWVGNRVGPSLLEILETLGFRKKRDVVQFIAYAYARKAIQLAGRGVDAGIELSDAKYVFDLYDGEAFRKASDLLTDWSNNALDYLVAAGGFSEELAAVVKAAHPVYIPMKRFFVDEMRYLGKRGYVDLSQVVKRIKGSPRAIINPLEGMAQYAHQLISQANKIRVARALARLARMEGLGGIIDKVPAPLEARKFNIEKIRKDLTDMGADLSEIDVNTMLTVFVNSKRYLKNDNIVAIFEGGEANFYEIANKELYHAIKGLDMETLPGILKVIFSKPSRTLRLGATALRPAFGYIRNPWRDAITWSIYSQAKVPNPLLIVEGLISEVPGARKMVRQSMLDAARHFRGMGGEFTTMMGQDRAQTMRVIDEIMLRSRGWEGKSLYVAKHPIDVLREMIGVTEMAPRIAEFEQILKKAEEKHGKGSDSAYIEAFNASQDVTVNFSRKGLWGPIFNDMTAFWNASVQGADKLYRMARHRPIAFLVRGLTAISMPSIWLWFLNKDRDWYKELPPEYKYSNWFFELPGGRIIRLPKPFELGALFGGGVESMLDAVFYKDPDAINAAFGNFLRYLSPEILPTVIQPPWDLAKNTNWLGVPLETQRMKRLEKPDRSKPWTSGIAKIASRAMFNILPDKYVLSPVQIDHLVSGYTGGLGLDIIKALDIENESDIPVVGTLFLRRDPYPRRSLERFYDDLKILRQMKGSGTITKQGQYRLSNLEKRSYRLRSVYSQMREALSEGNTKRQEYLTRKLEKIVRPYTEKYKTRPRRGEKKKKKNRGTPAIPGVGGMRAFSR